MFIISASKMFLCDEKFSILEDFAFVFDEVILEFGKIEILKQKYPNAKLIKTKANSLILPAFINPHTHLEFSANSYTLHFGDFFTWLKSVISLRQNLSQEVKDELITQTLNKMQKTGTSTIGEISSFGSDLESCAKHSMRVIYFNEILGTDKTQNLQKKEEFLKRFEKAMAYKDDLFIPAISIHSPYSTNLELAKFAISLAQKHQMLLSTHFLESKAENLWLKKSSGEFKQWLKNFTPNPKPLYQINEYIELFRGLRTLFTHCVYLKEFELLNPNLHSITHCAFSNRLLSQKSLGLKNVLKSGLNIHLGTDGLSSNISLSMLDEMRTNLLIHKDFELNALAKKLLLMATLYPAKALNLNLGTLAVGKMADFSVFEVKECDNTQLPLQFILNAKEVQKLFIKGKECKF
ncbi:aminofutalosine deaminase family hydrolase [Campylobacter helveticus]|uniref:aminofutalosine deaminase family hydrolase n=1 Tax=Campylobacter helveticus TaxID=28898 RepID=UPI00214A3F03|nr:metal-dependent hydrolase [Campylobacter helveticus]MCR2066610.1 metal-dependent hydrolase [Campylobacter helveticus]